MRRGFFWIPVGAVAILALTFWGVWTWRITAGARGLALELEAERQRSFNNMVYHVEQIQSLLGKGLAAGSTRQNMRYMGDTYYHAQAAVSNFTSLPLPAEVQATTGKFLQQVGDFSVSLLRNEAAGREMDARSRNDLTRLKRDSQVLSADLQAVAAEFNRGVHRWAPAPQFSWAALFGRAPVTPGKPTDTQSQAPESMVSGTWQQMSTTVEKMPALLYDGPFSDHVDKRAPAMSGAPVTNAEAASRIATLVPGGREYRVVGSTEVNGNLPAWSFQLAPGAGAPTASADVTKNGGHLLQYINSRITGRATIDLTRARTIGQEHLAKIGYPNMAPTYGLAEDGAATVAYAYQENGILVYPDQIKVKIALDNGEVIGVDARQYLMTHHNRTLGVAIATAEEAEAAVNPELKIQRVRLALIPDQAGTGEILTYEFLTTLDGDTYLVYMNANTGLEEQILQQVDTDGGTFAL